MKMKKLAAALLAGALVTSVAATSVSAEDREVSNAAYSTATSYISQLMAKYSISITGSVRGLVEAALDSAPQSTVDFIKEEGGIPWSLIITDHDLTLALESGKEALLNNDYIAYTVAVNAAAGSLSAFGVAVTPFEYSLWVPSGDYQGLITAPFGKVLTDKDGNEYVNLYFKYCSTNVLNGKVDATESTAKGIGSIKIITKAAPEKPAEGESNAGSGSGVIKPTGDNAGTVAVVSLIAMASILGVAVIRKKDELF